MFCDGELDADEMGAEREALNERAQKGKIDYQAPMSAHWTSNKGTASDPVGGSTFFQQSVRQRLQAELPVPN